MAYKDLFSKQADAYAKYRPTYPKELFQYLASLAPDRVCAWDCATGNGQAALGITPYFDKVIATDASEKQLALAANHPKITYRVGKAEASGIEDAGVSLTTVAQAFHWFDQPAFFEEVRRVSKPKAILAFWAYGLARIDAGVDDVILSFYEDTVGPYWDSARKMVDEQYRGVQIPFEEISHPNFQMEAGWNLEHMLGYLSSWSATQSAFRATGQDPVLNLTPKLMAAWGNPQEQKRICWSLALRIARV